MEMRAGPGGSGRPAVMKRGPEPRQAWIRDPAVVRENQALGGRTGAIRFGLQAPFEAFTHGRSKWHQVREAMANSKMASSV
jgi:hypothetical protein